MKFISLLGVLAWGLGAQTLMDPPALIRVVRTPGMDASAASPYVNAGSVTPVFGITSITGSLETWLIEAHDSFASIEQLDQAIRGIGFEAGNPTGNLAADDVLPPSRSWLAVYRPAWSYRPGEAIRSIAKARYFQISLYRTRPGTEADLADLLKARRVTFDSINLDRPDMVYQVISGAPAGTYLLVAPFASLKSLDDALAAVPIYARPEEKVAKQAAAEGGIMHENLLFRVEPEISYVSDDFAAADPSFWRPHTK
jgi:hypothetical protein